MVTVNHFEKEMECLYKEEKYSVRDNGGVLRRSIEGKRPRPTDNNWTFGKLNSKTGYLEIASVRVHRIVATAFHGESPTKEHVVDSLWSILFRNFVKPQCVSCNAMTIK